MTLLLVSVRSVEEAAIALRNGTDILDVKEPQRGSLGRADDELLLAVEKYAANRVPVTAALGEVSQNPAPPPCGFGGLVKVGLFHSKVRLIKNWLADWPLQERTVPVAYADYLRAGSPLPEAVLDLAASYDLFGVVVDTWHKDGTRLLDWLSPGRLRFLIQKAHRLGLFIALAGSLRLDDVPTLLRLEPDILGFRAAACVLGQRGLTMDAEAVARLSEAVHASACSSDQVRKLMTRTLCNRRMARGNHESTNPVAAQSFGVAP